MTRIGRVKTWWANDPAYPCFRLVVENGQLSLGVWRAVAFEDVAGSMSPRTIFERVS
jgi:hypothetical protein